MRAGASLGSVSEDPNVSAEQAKADADAKARSAPKHLSSFSRVCSDFSSVDRRQHLEADMQRKLDNHERHKAMQAAEYAERAEKRAHEEQERNEKFAELNRQSKAKGAQARADYAVKQQE